jgi:hypothetical protein
MLEMSTDVAPPMAEVPMLEAEAVRKMRGLAAQGWGAKRTARELGLARNTVRPQPSARCMPAAGTVPKPAPLRPGSPRGSRRASVGA